MAALVTVVVVDDHPFFRDGVARGLTQSGRIRILGEAGDGREALEVIGREQPDVALVDYQMPDMDGLAVVRAIKRDGLPSRVLLLSALTDSAIVFQALEEGAAGYLAKDSSRSEIVEAVVRVAKGDVVVPPALTVGLVEQIRLRSQPDGSRPERAGAADRPRLRPGSVDSPVGRGAVHRHEHGQDLRPAPLREAGRLGPRRRGGRGHATRSARVAVSTDQVTMGAARVPDAVRSTWRTSRSCRRSCSTTPTRGVRVQVVLRGILVAFVLAVVLWIAPAHDRVACDTIAAIYAVWAIGVAWLAQRRADQLVRFMWLALFVDLAALAGLAVAASSSVNQSWTSDVLVNGFFMIPILAATQLRPWVCTAVAVPTVAVYLGFEHRGQTGERRAVVVHRPAHGNPRRHLCGQRPFVAGWPRSPCAHHRAPRRRSQPADHRVDDAGRP